jgi:hypothetical protein
MLQRKSDTGALANTTTRRVLRRYSAHLVVRAIATVLALNGLTAAMVRIEGLVVIRFLCGALIIGLTFSVIGVLFSYARLVIMRWVLRQRDWDVAAGCVRTLHVGPVAVAQAMRSRLFDDGPEYVDYAGPARFARQLPHDYLPANVLVVKWRWMRVYSAFDGGSPTLAVPAMWPVRRLLGNIMRQS